MPGLERVLEEELAELSPALRNHLRVVRGGVAFESNLPWLFRLNALARTAERLWVEAASFPVRSFAELEQQLGAHKEELAARFLPAGTRVHLTVTSAGSKLYHETAVAERVRGTLPLSFDAPDDERDSASTTSHRLAIHLEHDLCSLRVDSSGAPLHRRGYRLFAGKAPLRETLAAAVLRRFGYDGSLPLLDPFCGSGTFGIEAALMARAIAPGSRRDFAFMRFPDFDRDTWKCVHDDVTTQRLDAAPAPIVCADRHPGAIAGARKNAERGVVDASIDWHCQSIANSRKLGAELGPRGWIVTNPPYGVRVGVRHDVRELYAELGAVVRSAFPEWGVAIVTADEMLVHATGLPLRRALSFSNGGIAVGLFLGHATGR